MLVNQAVCHIPLQPTLLRYASNRRIALDWNIQKSIERQFAQARKAWVRYQSTRQRDAVYGYLSAVFQVGVCSRCQYDGSTARHRSFPGHSGAK